jgi:O-antigen ligase
MLLLPLIAAAVPLSIGTGTGSVVVASVLFAVFILVLWLARILLPGRFLVLRSPLTLPLVGFMGTAALSTLYGEAVRPPLVTVWPTFALAQIGGLGMFVLSGGTLLVTMNVLSQLHWIKRLTFVFLTLGAVDIVAYLLQHRDLAGFAAGGLFSLWVVALALGQALFNRDLPTLARGGLFALAMAWMFRRFMFENGWLTGWVPISIAVLGLFFLRSRKHALLAVACTVVVGVLSFQDIYAREVAGNNASGSFLLGTRPGAAEGHQLRVPIWLQSLELAKDHLLLGTGPAGYAAYYVTYFPGFAFSSHNNYLDIFAETGLIGFFFFAWFLFAMFRVALDARKRSQTGFAAGFANGVLAGFLGLMVAMALGDWVIPFVYNANIVGFRHTIHSWIFLGALASLQRITSTDQETTAAT